MENQKGDTKRKYWREEGGIGSMGWHMHSINYEKDGQLRLAVKHREISSVFCDKLYGKKIYICIYE